jgi:hypothetical protein
MIQSFENISSENGVFDINRCGLKIPSATWTYLINDDPFEHKNGLEQFSVIGQNAWAGMAWPLMALLLLVKKMKNEKAKRFG